MKPAWAQVLHDRPEAPGGCVAARQDQRLGLEVRDAHGVAAREPVSLGEHHVEVVDEQAPPLQPCRLGHGQPGHVVDHREVGVAGAEALDRLGGLEL